MSTLDRKRPGPPAAPPADAGSDFALHWIGAIAGDAERRQVVVLACRFDHNFLGGAGADPEEMVEAMRVRNLDFARLATTHGGTVVPTEFDVLTAVWGWPVAGADDASRAVDAALELTNRYAGRCRCGLEAGIAVAETGERRLPTGMGVIGSVVNAALLLANSSPAGRAVASSTMLFILGGGVDVEPLRHGTPEPASRDGPWILLGKSAGPAYGESAASPLVAREAELAVIRASWRAVREGQSHRLHLQGAVGSGKSALLAHLFSQVASDGGKLLCVSAAAPDVLERLARPLPSPPFALVVEDLQTASPTLLDALADISRRLEAAGPGLLAVSHRCRPPAVLAQTGHWEHVKLGPLPIADIESLLGADPYGRELPPALRRIIAERAEGMPLYARELARQSAHTPEGEPWRRLLRQPHRLNAKLLASLDALGRLKPLALVAAVCGTTFELPVLAAVLSMESRKLLPELEELVEREILARPDATHPQRYAFTSALLWSVAYGSVLRSRRRDLHSRIAEELIAQRKTNPAIEPEAIAHHHTKSLNYAAAFHCWREAARAAVARGQSRKAIDLINHALAARLEAPEACSDLEEAELLSLLGGQCGILSGTASRETITAYQRAMHVLKGVGDAADDLRFEIKWGIGAVHHVNCEVGASLTVAAELMDLARATGRRDHLLLAMRMMGTAKLVAGELTGAIELLSGVRALYDPKADARLRFRFISDPCAVASAQLAYAHAVRGDFEATLEAERAALRLAGEICHSHTSASTLGMLATAAHFRGDLTTTLTLSRACESVSAASGHRYWAARAALVMCWVRSRQSAQNGLGPVGEAVRHFRRVGYGRGNVYADYLLAKTALDAGRPDRVIEIVAEAKARTTTDEQRVYRPELLRLEALAIAASDPGRADEAKALLQKAVMLAREHGAALFENRAATALANLQRG